MAVFLVCLALLAVAGPVHASARPAAAVPPPEVQEEPFPLYRYSLPNGLAVWVQPRPESQSVAALLVVHAGSRHEDSSNNGVAHFVEHMVFTGTDRWTEEQLKQVLTRNGGRYNGWTDKERTTYFAHIAGGDVDVALDWLAQVVFHPTFDPEKLDKERQVIFQERWGRYGWLINALDSLGFGYELDRAVQRALFPESSLDVRTTGEDDSLDSLDRDALLDFYGRYYTPGNATLILVGAVSPEEAAALAESSFGALEARGRPEPPATPPMPAVGPHNITVRGPMATDQVRFVAGARTVGRFHPDRAALDILAILVEGALTREIRYERGLVYGLSASNILFDDTGYFAITTTSKSGNEEIIREQADAYLERVSRGQIGAGTVAVAQRALKGRWLLSMEDNVARAKWLAEWSSALAPNEPVPDYRAAIDTVQPEDLASVVARYFTPERRFVGLHLPVVTLTGGVESALIAGLLVAGVSATRQLRRRRAGRRRAQCDPVA
ncbi:MAG TPA: pitrilysin family protein [Anaerolineae bacterium]|nr:pitrilysin family protein [Anaerolineae bacterium]